MFKLWLLVSTSGIIGVSEEGTTAGTVTGIIALVTGTIDKFFSPVATFSSTLLMSCLCVVPGRRQYDLSDSSHLWSDMNIMLRSVKPASLIAVMAVALRECDVYMVTPLF
jgi:hypothetical protein